MRTPGRIRPGRATKWLRAHDPELAATRRAVRAALVLPALFALCGQVIGSATMATFAAFGSFSMLLLVDFTGPMVQRLRAQVGLALAWMVLICLGTVVAHITWLAIATTVLVGFLVLFSGVVSSVLAGATTALLLAYVLPVTSPTPNSQLPERLAGAGLAAAAAVLAISLLWPRPAADPLSAPAARVCRAAAATLRSDAPGSDPCRATADRAAQTAATSDLRSAFDATTYRPTGLSADSRALVRLVDELTWLCGIVADSGPPSEGRPARDPSEGRPARDPDALAVRRGAALVLERAADLLDDPHGPPDALRAAVAGLRQAMTAMEHSATTRLPVHLPGPATPTEVRSFLGTLDQSFRAQELGFATLQIAGNVDLAAAAAQRSWPERLFGREPGTAVSPLAAARDRAAAHLEPHSVWLHNSLRGALGLGIAVFIAHATGLQHSFWVLLGTLSVLRSNALSTGQKALRAVGGTVAGSLIGSGLLHLIGHHGTLLWFLLPLAVLLAGVAPAAISFAAGQAAFTVTIVVLFNIGHRPNWHVALLRVQDIALGCAVSVLVGLLFWPRGAAAAIDRALAAAYTDSTRYLSGAVKYAVGRCGTGPAPASDPQRERRQAAAAARRLDDAFRGYLAERGPKPMPLAPMTTLVTGVVGLRLAADAVLGLWQSERPSAADRADACLVLLGAAKRVSDWYGTLAASLDRRTAVPDPLPRSTAADAGLVASIRRDLGGGYRPAAGTAVRIVWTADHLDAARRLQPGLAAAVRGDGPS
ncbi:FUSC family protein [Streptomyces glomeratus]|uniref:FUSC family protein n=1 Tax=Streptomyces glomeratus TaxID=284452 RepID=UPI001F46BB4C|nr:FUSC family protein [Streptomyces glomeratus]MCF1509230.1 FUSC family protein [Streptomyces glomeratus]